MRDPLSVVIGFLIILILLFVLLRLV
jgi:hypothetical protein